MNERDQYFSAEGTNATAIKAGRESMSMMRHTITDKIDRPTPAMVMGTLIHEAVLEPELMSGWAVCEAETWKAKGVKKWREENEGRTQVLSTQLATLMKISASVWGNSHAAHMIRTTEHEVPMFWDDRLYGKAKAKLDGISDKILIDVKTTKGPLTDYALDGLFFRMGYHIQMGWYREGANACGRGIDNDAAYIIWVRQDKDFDCRVMQVAPSLIDMGTEEAIEIAKRYHICEATNSFPGVSQTIDEISAPGWVDSQLDMEGLE